MVKTRTVRRREVHIKEMKAVDSVTERLITINRMDVQLEYKLTESCAMYWTRMYRRGKFPSVFALVTSTKLGEEILKSPYDCQ